MATPCRLKLLVVSLAALLANPSIATDREIEEALGEPGKRSLLIPYAFYNENTEAAVALAWATTGYVQPQSSTVMNAYYSANDSYNLFARLDNFQMPFAKRLFFNAWMFAAEWGETESYQDGNPNFLNERAGSNDSHEDNFVTAEGSDGFYRLEFEYLLPIGDGKGDPIHTFTSKNGVLVKGSEAGGREWNPLTSGRTKLEFQSFYRDQDLEDEFDNDFRLETLGFTLGLIYDNTNWSRNPSHGSRLRVAGSRDWGALDDDAPKWTLLEFEFSKYFDLGATDKSRQRTIATNVWTSHVTTWNDSHMDDQGNEVFHRPPLFMGSTLGGIDRQRGFATNRFHDRSAINYVVEYRDTRVWNPFPNIPLINKLEIPWWQWVAFLEAGRVADDWELDELHSDMKFSFGVGVRMSVRGLIVRVDLAGSEEGGEIQMFIGHTFD